MSEMARVRVLVITTIAFFISMFASCSEMKYQLWGKTTTAELLKVTKVQESRRSHSLALDYQFTDADGQVRKEEDRVSTSWVPPAAPEGQRPTIQVDYIPGSPGTSRLDGQSNIVFVIIFLAILGFLVLQVAKFWKGYQEHERRMARER